MAKISMELLHTERNLWGEMDESLKKAGGKKTPFGKYMQDKYAFREKDLENEPDTNRAMLIILKNHVEEIR
jgi:hypothetical protein